MKMSQKTVELVIQQLGVGAPKAPSISVIPKTAFIYERPPRKLYNDALFASMPFN